jgi:hypothetical protein
LLPTAIIEPFPHRVHGQEAQVWGPGEADPPRTIRVDDELGMPIQYRDGIDGTLLAFETLDPSRQHPVLFTVPAESP